MKLEKGWVFTGFFFFYQVHIICAYWKTGTQCVNVCEQDVINLVFFCLVFNVLYTISSRSSLTRIMCLLQMIELMNYV